MKGSDFIKRGPMMVGGSYVDGGPGEGSFREAFASAKKKGEKTFNYKGRSYTTETAAEKAKKQTLIENENSASNGLFEAGKRMFKSKSHNEIYKSYADVYTEQYKKKYRP